jgi:hypothetical protein
MDAISNLDISQRGAATQGGASFQLANLFINNHRKLEARPTHTATPPA